MTDFQRQLVSGKQAEEIYDRLVDVSRATDFEETEFRDRDMIKKTLSVLLMTQPIDENEPFEVERGERVRPDLTGHDFEIESAKFTPRDTMFGGIYDIHFYALSPRNNYYYEFEGQVSQAEPQLTVETAVLEHVPDKGMDINPK